MKQNVKIYADQIEDEALKQIETIAGLEAFKNEKIAIMPDVHAGKGCVIGFTASYSDSIIPNLVGVDIGCGMLAVNVGKDEIDFAVLDALTVQNIPMGFGKNEVPVDAVFDYNALYCCHEIGEKAIDNAVHSICSLGGGNHFISSGLMALGLIWIGMKMFANSNDAFDSLLEKKVKNLESRVKELEAKARELNAKREED